MRNNYFTFNEGSLSDSIELIIDHRGLTPKKLGGDWSSNGYRAISAKNVKNGRLVAEESIHLVSPEMYEKWMPIEVKENDILITSEAPFGETIIWKSKEKIVISQRIFCLRINERFSPEYIYYYMLTNSFKAELSSRATGTTVTGLRQPELLKCKILFPKLNIQKKIARVLSSIDNKIELNNKINDNIQEQIHTLYSNYFSDIESCEEVELGSLIERKNSKIKDREDWINLPIIDLSIMPQFNAAINNYSSGSSFTTNINKLDEYDLLFGSIRSYFGKAGFSPISGGVAGTVFSFIPIDSVYYSFVFATITDKRFIDKTAKLSSGTKMPIINWDTFCGIKVKVSKNREIEKRFNLLVMPLIEQIKIKINENQKLVELRDTLLPKLMSGEINVENVEI